MAVTQVDVLLLVVATLEKLRIPYCVGGSFASSLYGISRSTRDIDLLAAIEPEQVKALAAELEPHFYADEVAIANAIRAKRSFNVIHLDSMFKVDVFVSKGSGFDAIQLERGQLRNVMREPPRTAVVATAEDTVLAKLVWYRRGNEISDQQWRDIINVLKVQAGQLDLNYMRQWSRELNVDDLLEEAFKDSEA